MATATAKKPTTTKAPASSTPAEIPTPTEPTKEATPTAAPETAPVPTSLVEALTAGSVVLMKVRANGTKRSLPYLAVGTEERKQAEAVAARRAKDETVAAIAQDLKVSVASARRFLTNLQNAQDVEAGKHDALWTPDTKAVVIQTVQPKG